MTRTTSTVATAVALALALAGCSTAAAPATAPAPASSSSPAPTVTVTASPTATYSRPPITLVAGSFATKYASAGVEFPWTTYPTPAGTWNPGEAAWGCQYMVSTVKPTDDAEALVVALLAARQAEHPDESRAVAGEAVVANIDGVCKPFVTSTANTYVDSLEG